MKQILIWFVGFLSLNLHAEISDLSFGTGLINQHVGRIQTTADGSRNSFDHRVFIETDLTIKLNERWSLIPQGGFVWPGQEENDYIKKYNYFFIAHVGYSRWEKFRLRFGGGGYFTYISGDGGTVDLPNGNTTTAFYVPENQSTASNMVFSLAGQYFLRKDVSLKLEAMVFNPTNTDNRTFTYTLAIRYHFGDSLWSN